MIGDPSHLYQGSFAGSVYPAYGFCNYGICVVGYEAHHAATAPGFHEKAVRATEVYEQTNRCHESDIKP